MLYAWVSTCLDRFCPRCGFLLNNCKLKLHYLAKCFLEKCSSLQTFRVKAKSPFIRKAFNSNGLAFILKTSSSVIFKFMNDVNLSKKHFAGHLITATRFLSLKER